MSKRPVPGYAPAAVSHALAVGGAGAAGTAKGKIESTSLLSFVQAFFLKKDHAHTLRHQRQIDNNKCMETPGWAQHCKFIHANV